MKYIVVFDAGLITFEQGFESFEALKEGLTKFYHKEKNSGYPFDCQIFNDKNEDISETQEIEELITSII